MRVSRPGCAGGPLALLAKTVFFVGTTGCLVKSDIRGRLRPQHLRASFARPQKAHPRGAIVSLSVHGETARYADGLAGDVGGVIGQQEGDEPRIILRYAEAPHRDGALEPLGEAGAVGAFEKAAQNGGVGRSGTERIEDHALAHELASDRLGEGDDAALAGGIDRLAGGAD